MVFDRYTDRLRAFTLVSGRYQELELTEPRIWMPLLELGLGLWQGECQGVDRLWLRWYDAEGNWIWENPVFANILVGAKHFGSKSLVITNNLYAEMLRPYKNEMHPWILTEAEQERQEKELAQQQLESSQQQLESAQQQLEIERQRAAELAQRLRDLGIEMLTVDS